LQPIQLWTQYVLQITNGASHVFVRAELVAMQWSLQVGVMLLELLRSLCLLALPLHHVFVNACLCHPQACGRAIHLWRSSCVLQELHLRKACLLRSVVVGGCKHHHILTQSSWDLLRQGFQRTTPLTYHHAGTCRQAMLTLHSAWQWQGALPAHPCLAIKSMQQGP
jgi:hypothetical protein